MQMSGNENAKHSDDSDNVYETCAEWNVCDSCNYNF